MRGLPVEHRSIVLYSKKVKLCEVFQHLILLLGKILVTVSAFCLQIHSISQYAWVSTYDLITVLGEKMDLDAPFIS